MWHANITSLTGYPPGARRAMTVSLQSAIHVEELLFSDVEKLAICLGVSDGMKYLHSCRPKVGTCCTRLRNAIVIPLPPCCENVQWWGLLPPPCARKQVAIAFTVVDSVGIVLH